MNLFRKLRHDTIKNVFSLVFYFLFQKNSASKPTYVNPPKSQDVEYEDTVVVFEEITPEPLDLSMVC